MENKNWFDDSLEKCRLNEDEKLIDREELVVFYFNNLADGMSVEDALKDPTTLEFLSELGYVNFKPIDFYDILNRKMERDIFVSKTK